MLYGNIINENYTESFFTEQDLKLKLMQENVDMQFNILRNMTSRSYNESYMEVVTESTFKEKVSKVMTFLKKIITSFFKFVKETANSYVILFGLAAQYLPKIGKYVQPINFFKMSELKPGTHLVEYLPKNLMDNIHELSSKSNEDLEKMCTKEYVEEFRDKLASDCYKKVKPIKSIDEINAYDMINLYNDTKNPDHYMQTLASAYVVKAKLSIKSLQDRTKKLESTSKSLCEEYNSKLDKIEKMMNADSPSDYTKAQWETDVLVLDVLQNQYKTLFFVASKAVTMEHNAIKICMNTNNSLLKLISDMLAEGRIVPVTKDEKAKAKAEKEKSNK